MRPLLFGTDGTKELRIACERLARVFEAARNQRARLSNPGIFLVPTPQRPDIPPTSTLNVRSKFSEPLGGFGDHRLNRAGCSATLGKRKLLGGQPD